jgi:hypothetical protein
MDYENSTVSISVEFNDYPTNITNNPQWFFPGDTIELTIESTGTTDGLEDIFDIIMFRAGETSFVENVGIFDDIALDPGSGKAILTVPGTKTVALSDGMYEVYVGDEVWIEDSGFDSGRVEWDMAWFWIQMYVIEAQTDRVGYLPGDTVTVSYSVISITDGYLITDANYPGWNLDEGEWGVWSEDGETNEGPISSTEPSGSFNFQISALGSIHPWEYLICYWYNGTYGSERNNWGCLGGNSQEYDLKVDMLSLTVQTDNPEYQIGGTASIDVHTGINGTAASEPDVDVQIQILEGSGLTADKISGYGGNFVSDANGEVRYEFSISDSDFEDGETYTVRVNASKHLWAANKDVTFEVSGILDSDDDGINDTTDTDDDNDGYSDIIEEQEGSDPKDETSRPLDNDEDYDPDSTDTDDDNDGYSDVEELEAGSDPMDPTSVPADVAAAPEDIWVWLAPAIVGIVALVVTITLLLLMTRPPKEALVVPEDSDE